MLDKNDIFCHNVIINNIAKNNIKSNSFKDTFYNNQIDNNKGTLLQLIDSSNIYFDENLQETQFFYDVMDIDLDEPIALSLSFNQKSKFDININVFGNETFIIKKQISNTTNIFFNNKFKKGDQLVININNLNQNMLTSK